tara:strand:- start:885 stop:1325 length:441 start_codon:yes stop_codon:yes gene_type:complete
MYDISIQIYSKIDSERLLHQVWKKEAQRNKRTERVDLVEPNQFIQCSALHLQKGKKFKPHRHIWKELNPSIHIAQESWFVVSGRVKAFFYDVDDTLLEEIILSSGDVSFTFEAGHTYEILENDTYVMEYKTGPYEGVERDKTFLKE